MNMLILSPEQQIELEALNHAGSPLRQLHPAILADERRALNADLLADCAEGQTWAHYRALLQTLVVDSVQPELLPQ